jgi:hypothetical protein
MATPSKHPKATTAAKPAGADDKAASNALALPENILNWIIFGLYSALLLYITSNHEPWRDEAQSWLIARDLSIGGLFRYLPNEGHPPLWYLILMPFAKLGLPYATVNLVSNVIAMGIAWLVLFKSRYPLYLKIAMIFSYFFLFEYAVIARNYGIVMLLLMAIAAVYDKRHEQPFVFAILIFLLFQTNVLAFCTGAGLGLIYLVEVIREKRLNAKSIGAMAIMAAGGLAMIVLLLSAGMKSSYTKLATDKLGAVTDAMGNALLLDKTSGIVALFLYLLLALALFRKPLVLLFLTVAVAGYCYLVAYKFQGTMRHHGFLLVFILAAYAYATRYNPLKQFEKYAWIEKGGVILLSALLGMQVLKGSETIMADVDGNFTDAKNAAEFITKNGLDKYEIVGHRSYAASAVVPYLPNNKPVWYADQQRYGTFVYLDTVFFNNYMKYSGDYAPYIASQKFKNLDSVILLMSVPIEYPAFVNEWEPVYQTRVQPIQRDEMFIIYRHRPKL